jgi:hypothetical protein
MPGPQEVAGEEALEGEAVEGSGVGTIVGHGATHQHLTKQQQSDDDKEFDQRFLPQAIGPVPVAA